MEDNPPKEPPLQFRLRPLLITTLVVAAILGVTVPAFRAARQAQQRQACLSNLQCIAQACSWYHDTYKAFPPAITYNEDGKAMHSWRVLISPFLESSGFYDAYDFKQPWNGPNNRSLGDEIPDMLLDTQNNPYQCLYGPRFYRCPGTPQSQDRMLTNYVMLIDDRNGSPERSHDATPRTGSSIIILEIADTDIHWMEPRDVLLSDLRSKTDHLQKNRLPGRHGGVCVVRGDGSIEVLDEPVTTERLEELLAE